MAALTRLEAVSICSAQYSQESMAPLERLPRLQSAAFSGCEVLPGCLSRLTGLRRLGLDCQYVFAGHVEALLRLSQLTCLALTSVTDEDVALPGALQQMSQLRALAWFVCGPPEDPLTGRQPVLAVPDGPWLGRLQQLEADVLDVAAILPSATSLEQLSLAASPAWQDPEGSMQQLTDALRCAAALPRLREVSVHAQWSPHAAAPAAVLEALAGSPAHLHWTAESDLSNHSALQGMLFEEGGIQRMRGYAVSLRM